ncbi:MAG: exosortase J [Acidobacteriaceae bacterium]
MLLKPRSVVALACGCAAVGLFTIHGAVAALLVIWRDDDLKSMGLVVPFVVAGLILRAWRKTGWRAEGSWWGFTLLAGTALVVFLRTQTLLIVTVDKGWLVQIPPLPLVAILYAAAMTLIFGGKRLLREAWFPVLLMAAVIPVPHVFSSAVDLPLQHASATVARAFAHALGQPLTQDKLRLMFTPDFGMFIAPGCNGIRGAVTLGLSAVVVGYMYRFRWFVYAPVVVGAVLLGYLFNFLRLCLLVVYYKIALPYPWLQHRAKTADYIIGGGLFLAALFIFFAVANRLRQQPRDVRPEPRTEPPPIRVAGASVLWRSAAVLALSAIFAVDTVHAYREFKQDQALRPTLVAFPQKIGDFTLTRTWTETLIEGTVVYAWGEYVGPGENQPGGQPGSGAHIAFGISPLLGLHDTTTCHMVRGESPKWVGQIDAPTAGGAVSLAGTLFNNGASQKLEAATVCDEGVCRQYSQSTQHMTMVFNRPRRTTPLQAATTRPVPVLLKAELADTGLPAPVAAERLAEDIRSFLSGANLPAMTRPYSVQ